MIMKLNSLGMFILLSLMLVHLKLLQGISIVSTIVPLGEFAEIIGGDRVEVSVLIPPGADPHTFEPVPSQMRALDKADLLIITGAGLDFELTWMDKILELNREITVCDCSRGVDLIRSATNHSDHGHPDRVDPHVWLSPRNAMIIIDNITEAICELDAANAGYYEPRAESYQDELLALHKEIINIIRDLERRAFLVYHPSWAYFAREYNLVQHTIEQDGKEPTVRELTTTIDRARENDIRVIFISPQFSTKSAQVIASEINARLLVIDPLAYGYCDNLRNLAHALQEAGNNE
ncbi:MAG: zinc ABC transporter substrate-binding protein [Candidatus Cloacimonetes bacterium]|nr:zinc ABC transporter substrate-binding protein [Candidatus Cloacimonadota bacterium]